MPRSREIALLLASLDQAYDHHAWHGPNLRGSIRGLSAREASRRPGRGRHNIWEIVVHAAYWKYIVRRRMSGETRGSFPLEGSNWFPRGDRPNERAWREDIALLQRMHRELRTAVARLDPRLLGRSARGSAQTYQYMIAGAAMHDVYHAGQIGLLKKLVGRGRPSARAR